MLSLSLPSADKEKERVIFFLETGMHSLKGKKKIMQKIACIE